MPKRLTLGTGLLGAFTLIAGWFAGCGGAFAAASLAVSTGGWFELERVLGGRLANAGVISAPGAALFPLVVAVGHGLLMHGRLSRPRWVGWIAVTLIASVVAWLLTCGLFFYPAADVRAGLDSALRDVALGSPADLQLLVFYAGLGALAGGVGGLVLGLTQWAVLRGQVGSAGWWIAVDVAGQAILLTLFLSLI